MDNKLASTVPHAVAGSSRSVLDAFFYGRAFAEVANQRLGELADEALVRLGKLDAERQQAFRCAAPSATLTLLFQPDLAPRLRGSAHTVASEPNNSLQAQARAAWPTQMSGLCSTAHNVAPGPSGPGTHALTATLCAPRDFFDEVEQKAQSELQSSQASSTGTVPPSRQLPAGGMSSSNEPTMATGQASMASTASTTTSTQAPPSQDLQVRPLPGACAA